MKLTQEQIEKFWKWCGFTQNRIVITYVNVNRPDGTWNTPDGKDTGDLDLPPIDLNNLFKWAVPKLFTWSIGKNWELQSNLTIKKNGIKASVDLTPFSPDKYDVIVPSEYVDKDPALALFWAIYKVMEAK